MRRSTVCIKGINSAHLHCLEKETGSGLLATSTMCTVQERTREESGQGRVRAILLSLVGAEAEHHGFQAI